MEAFITSLQYIATPMGVLLCALGALLGLILGAIPGLSGGIGVTILIPITYAMDPNYAMILLMAVYIGGVSGAYIGSILLGIPGSTSSIATVYDGYEMTKKGEAVRALSVGTTANAIGTIPSILIAMVACQYIAKFAVGFGPWEYFALCFFAISLVVTMSRGQVLHGLISAGIAIGIACVGSAPVCGTLRFTFGVNNLLGGVDLLCVMMGIFAGRTILMEYAKGDGGSDQKATTKVGRFHLRLEDFTSNIRNIVVSFVMGLWIGFLPGMGPALSNVAAYATAKNSSKYPEKFGTGIVDGVWAPEVANNAATGGAIIPMISLGIPGDGATAIIMGALTIYGVQCGPLIYRNDPDVVYTIFLTCLVAAVFVLVVEILGMPLFPRFLQLPYHYLYPAIVVMCFVGIFASTSNIFNISLCVLFTFVGVWMGYANIPTGPFMLAFVLADMVETNFRKALNYSETGVLSFFTRPISCILIVGTILYVAYPYVKDFLAGRKARKSVSKEG